MKRPFRALRDREPHKRYDAIIIGAGVGGLVCANLLAKEGLSVLLVEQHYMVGGYCSTFRRKGYTFDAATHFYPLLGNTSTLTGKLLVDLGVETLWVKMDPVDTFHFPDGSRFTVPADFDSYRRRLEEEFPHQQEALNAFFEDVRQAYLRGLLVYFRDRPEERLGPYRHWSVRDALDRHFDDPKLKLLLTADCPHWGSPPKRTSFVFDSMLRLSYFLGNFYPEGGSQAFVDEMARCFEERGGDILMSSQVHRILAEDDRVAGIQVETLRGNLRGERTIQAATVISNADMLLTLEHLLGHRHVPWQQVEALRRLRSSFPCFLTHIALEGVSHQALDEAQGYYWQGWDPDRVGKDSLACKIFCPTLYEPRMAPEGGQIVILQKVLELDQSKISDWQSHKREIEDFVLNQFEKALPGVREKIVVHTSASASTSHRFTLNHQGAMLGWEMAPDQLGANRPSNEGPVEGLYFVGHWTRPGGGITPAIMSALHVAQAVAGAGTPTRETESVPRDLAFVG